MSDDAENDISAKAAKRIAERARRKGLKQRKEFTETMAILARVREVTIEAWARSPLVHQRERERLYSLVQVVDAMTGEMQAVMNTGEEALEAFVQKIAAGGADGQ